MEASTEHSPLAFAASLCVLGDREVDVLERVWGSILGTEVAVCKPAMLG